MKGILKTQKMLRRINPACCQVQGDISMDQQVLQLRDAYVETMEQQPVKGCLCDVIVMKAMVM